MNVNTLKMSKFDAEVKLDEYKSLNPKTRTTEDDKMEAVFKAIAKTGARVINVAKAFSQTGLNELGQPKLAMARADWTTVRFIPRVSFIKDGWSYRRLEGNGGFTPDQNWNHLAKVKNFALPAKTFDNTKLTDKWLKSPVPHIPPSIRPVYQLSNYHILFEVEKWEEYPVDPFLLKRIHGNLFLIEEEWELTALEAELLQGIISGT